MRCEDDVDGGEGDRRVRGADRGRPLLPQNGRGAGIVAGVGAFFGVEAGAWGFGVEVCAAHELDASNVVLFRRLLEVLRDARWDAAQVALVGCVDQSSAVFLGIVLSLKCNGPLLKADVGDFLFGAGEEAHTLCSGGVAGFGDGGPHLWCGVLLVLEETECVTTETRPSEMQLVNICVSRLWLLT